MAAPVGHNPDLKQVRRIPFRRISFAVPHARPRTHALPVAGANGGPISHAVLVLQGTFENVSNDLHVAMGMHGEAVATLHPVFVDDAQGAKSHKARIAIGVKGKCVLGVEPAEVASAALVTPSNRDHSWNPRYNDYLDAAREKTILGAPAGVGERSGRWLSWDHFEPRGTMPRNPWKLMLLLVLLGCGGQPDAGPDGFVNQTRHSDAELWTIWKAAQQTVAHEVDLNPLQRSLSGATADIRPGDAGA